MVGIQRLNGNGLVVMDLSVLNWLKIQSSPFINTVKTGVLTTDSNYIHFPHLKNAQETWDHALYVASEVTKMFPKPIVLEFEEEIYYWFFILSKVKKEYY
jgi:hypothetical protein